MSIEAPALSVSSLIGQSPLSRFQIRTIALLGLVTVLDGFDAQTIGYLAPSIAESTHIPIHTFGPIFSASLVGLMIAAMITGPVADRWGRKWPIILCTLSLAVFSFLTGFATSFNQLLIFRFLTGFGLGGAMPNVISLATEYSPKRLLPIVVSVLISGMPLGGLLCGLVSSSLILTWGWRSVFYTGGAVPLAISLLLVLVLPESIEFLVAQGKDPEDIGNILERISPGLAAAPISLAPVLGDQRPSRAPVKDLFTEGRAVGTLLLWFPFFMSLLVIYFIVSWLPALFRDSGMAISTGVRAAAFFSFGGIFGSLAEGLLIGGFGAYRILMAEFGLAGLLIGALAFVPSSFGLAVTLTFALGFVVMGAQAGLNVQAAVFYPMSIRSTGIGWGLAIGRIGSIVGPLIGGVLLSNGWMPRQLLFFGAVCAISAWLAIFLSSFSRRFPNAYSAQLHSP